MNEDVPVNAMGGSSPQGGGDIAMPEMPLRKRLRDILKRDDPSKTIANIRAKSGAQGSLFPNTKKKIGLDLPDEDFRGDLMKKALIIAKERSYG